ncbi:DMT family transporter [Streptosporangium sp. NPDC001559]|uniref:DMT family transporter n=1 Tax=Streptosporangium sp. NPDC001559 TaxID=3366187 RepID=UPI0036EC7930
MLHSGPLPIGRAVFSIAVAAVAWGTGGVVAAVLHSTSGLDPLTVSFWRFFGGTAALALAWPLTRPPGVPSLVGRLRSGLWRFTVTGAGMAVYQTAYFASVNFAGVAVATVVTLGFGPVLVALGARLWLAERLGGRKILVIVVALAGLTALVFGGDPATGSTARAPLLGVGLALLSAVGYAGTTLLSQVIGSEEGGDDPVGNALIGFAIGSVCLLPFALALGILPERGAPMTVGALLAYLGLFPSALAYGLFFTGLRTVPATTASIITLVEPLAAAVIAVCLLGERLTTLALFGGAVLLSTVVVLAVTRHDRPEEAESRRMVVTRAGELESGGFPMTVFVLLRGRRPVAELEVTGDDFPHTYCEVRPLPGFEEIRPVLVAAWEAVVSNGPIWPILRMRTLRLRLRPGHGGPLIRHVTLILNGDRATLRYRYGRRDLRRFRRTPNGSPSD